MKRGTHWRSDKILIWQQTQMRYFVYFDSTGRALLIRIDKTAPRPGFPSPLRNVGSPRTSSGGISRGRSTPVATPQREDECQRSLAQEAQVPDSPPENSSEAHQVIIDRLLPSE